jgi:phosphoribosylformylglycinamidine cyclo-ligase
MLEAGAIKGMAHITGGGITDNLPRVLPPGTAALVDPAAWEVPPLFRWLQRGGDVPIEDMRRTFNMGVGLIVIAGPERQRELLGELERRRCGGAGVIGRVVPGNRSVIYQSDL